MKVTTKDELQLVLDSITEAPEHFKELYDDFVKDSIGETVAVSTQSILKYVEKLYDEILDMEVYIALKAHRDSL